MRYHGEGGGGGGCAEINYFMLLIIHTSVSSASTRSRALAFTAAEYSAEA